MDLKKYFDDDFAEQTKRTLIKWIACVAAMAAVVGLIFAIA